MLRLKQLPLALAREPPELEHGQTDTDPVVIDFGNDRFGCHTPLGLLNQSADGP